MTALPPILEFDPDPDAIINPRPSLTAQPLPERMVLCFFQDVIDELRQTGLLIEIDALHSEMGRNPIYAAEFEGRKIGVMQPGLGAALAGGFLDEVIARGARKFIACGGCGVLLPDIAAGHPVVLTSAVRDEGLSYHYLPPGREACASPAACQALETVLQRQAVPYLTGKSWTTDGFYRETPAKRARRIEEGCCVVEMEASAFFAVAEFRQVIFGQIVYGGDLVIPNAWDDRGWNTRSSDRHRLLQLSLEACCLL